MDSPASASTFRLVVKREPLTEKTKSSGVSSCHLRQLSGLKVE
jgi:hypothetical protein